MLVDKFNPSDVEKMSNFVARLLSNPNFVQNTPYEKEEFISNFFKMNEEQLKPTFQSAAYFPHLDWLSIKLLFNAVIGQKTKEAILAEINNKLSTLNFSVIRKLQSPDAKLSVYSTKIKDFLNEALNERSCREEVNSLNKILDFQVMDKYLKASNERKKHIYFTLIRGEAGKLGLSFEDYVDLLKISFLLKSFAYLKFDLLDDRGKVIDRISIAEVKDDERRLKNALQKASKVFSKYLPNIPEKLYNLAINSNLGANKFDYDIEFSANFIAIFSQLGKSLKVYNKIDKGAETPEKSWFDIVRKNYAYYGFSKDILDELYNIAAESRW